MRFLLSFLLLSCSVFGAGELVGHHAPGFSLRDGSNRYHDPQDYRGKLLVVEFMQTSCPHCAAFSKVLEEVAAKYSGKLSILSIVNPPDTPDNVSKFVAANKINIPILFDCGQVAVSYAHWMPGKAGSFDIPRVFLIDAAGVIRRDLEYSVLTKDIFEGKGLFAEIDKLLQPQASSPGKKQ